MVKMVEGERRDESVVIAIDRDKGSQGALKWAVDNLLTPGETLTLVHVRVKQTLTNNGIYHRNAHKLYVSSNQLTLNKNIIMFM